MVWYKALSTRTIMEEIPRWKGHYRVAHFIVKGELFTEKEAIRMKLPMKCLEKVELPRSRVYRFFGCRFDDQDMENPVRREAVHDLV